MASWTCPACGYTNDAKKLCCGGCQQIESEMKDATSMLYPVNIGVGKNILIEVYGWLSLKTQIYVDSQPAQVSSQRNQFTLQIDDQPVIALVKRGSFITVPHSVIINQIAYPFGRKLRWFEWVWSLLMPFLLPVALFVLGFPITTGLLAVWLLVAPSMGYSIRLFKLSQMKGGEKYARTAGIFLITALGNMILGYISVLLGFTRFY